MCDRYSLGAISVGSGNFRIFSSKFVFGANFKVWVWICCSLGGSVGSESD